MRKQSKYGVIHEGEGHWPKFSQKLQEARHLWVARTLQNNKEEGARALLVTCGTRSPIGRGQNWPFSAQGAAGRLLLCPRAMRDGALAGRQELLPPFLVRRVAVNRDYTNSNMLAGRLWPSGPSLSLSCIIELNPYIFHQTPRSLLVVVFTACFETLARPSTFRTSRLRIPRRVQVPR